MLFYLYIIITIVIAAVILAELFREKSWRHQAAMVIILIPLVLRIFQIK
ncbi:MAG: hypothetical protein NTV54_03395 [Ignavibacteriales bacterium]|nr:hypothetical protein [Ignavibacteriales bacterium]